MIVRRDPRVNHITLPEAGSRCCRQPVEPSQFRSHLFIWSNFNCRLRVREVLTSNYLNGRGGYLHKHLNSAAPTFRTTNYDNWKVATDRKIRPSLSPMGEYFQRSKCSLTKPSFGAFSGRHNCKTRPIRGKLCWVSRKEQPPTETR